MEIGVLGIALFLILIGAEVFTNALEHLGERLGISKERVRQIENRALEKLRGRLLQQHGDAHAWVG